MAEDNKPIAGYQSQLASRTLDILKNRTRLPIEVMLDAMDALVEAGQLNAAAAIAIQAAPYVHPRLKDVVLTGDGDGGSVKLDLQSMRNLTQKELDTMESLMMKVVDQVIEPDDA